MAARQAAFNSLLATETYSTRGIPTSAAATAFPLSWMVVSRGTLTLGADVIGLVSESTISTISALEGIAKISMAGPIAAAIALLFFPASAGDHSDSVVPGRDINAMMSGDILSLPDSATLTYAADNQTGVIMAIRGRLVARDDGVLVTELVRTENPSIVPVVRAVLDSATGYWGYTIPAMPGVPSKTILVSPSDAPGTDGNLTLGGTLPLPEKILHTGDQVAIPNDSLVTISPVQGEVDFKDLVLIFPEESGLKPVYIMLSGIYGQETEKGKYSGRGYNPNKAGGPVQDLDWSGTVIDQTGIDKVKLHTGRFGQSDANQVMINRLDKILKGELQATDIDKRFYTHEIRELERYRALGVPDGIEDQSVWNDAHTATLEDYKVNEKNDPLYTPEAIQAYEEQEMREFK